MSQEWDNLDEMGTRFGVEGSNEMLERFKHVISETILHFEKEDLTAMIHPLFPIKEVYFEITFEDKDSNTDHLYLRRFKFSPKSQPET